MEKLKYYSGLINEYYSNQEEISNATVLANNTVNTLNIANNSANNSANIALISGTIRLSKSNATSGIFIAKFRKKKMNWG